MLPCCSASVGLRFVACLFPGVCPLVCCSSPVSYVSVVCLPPLSMLAGLCFATRLFPASLPLSSSVIFPRSVSLGVGDGRLLVSPGVSRLFSCRLSNTRHEFSRVLCPFAPHTLSAVSGDELLGNFPHFAGHGRLFTSLQRVSVSVVGLPSPGVCRSVYVSVLPLGVGRGVCLPPQCGY